MILEIGGLRYWGNNKPWPNKAHNQWAPLKTFAQKNTPDITLSLPTVFFKKINFSYEQFKANRHSDVRSMDGSVE